MIIMSCLKKIQLHAYPPKNGATNWVIFERNFGGMYKNNDDAMQ